VSFFLVFHSFCFWGTDLRGSGAKKAQYVGWV